MEAVNFLSQPSNWTPRLKPGDRAWLEGVVYPALPEDDASVGRRSQADRKRKWRENMRDDPERYAEYQAKQRAYRRTYDRKKAARKPCVGCGAEMKGEHGSAKWCERCRGDE